MHTAPETLAIVTGANSSLGGAYLKGLSRQEGVRPVGVSRSKVNEYALGLPYVEGVDLLRDGDIERVIEETRIKEMSRVLLVHSVGKFKFEDTPPPLGVIDDEVLRTNLESLERTINAIAQNIRADAQLTVCGFGSISDAHDVPFWRSYTGAKNKVRGFLRHLRTKFEPTGTLASSVMVNVGSTDTGNERCLRPNADKSYWLHPEKIVDTSLPYLLNEAAPPYVELDVFEAKPGFDPAAYYGNHAALLEKWKRETGQSQ